MVTKGVDVEVDVEILGVEGERRGIVIIGCFFRVGQ